MPIAQYVLLIHQSVVQYQTAVLQQNKQNFQAVQSAPHAVPSHQ
jgi:hypothetical protein